MIIEALHLINYEKCWELQERFFQQAIESKLSGGKVENRLFLVEHPHVYTLGKSGMATNLLVSNQHLNQLGAQFVKVNRGGDITYHGPGQLVAYPIFDIEHYNISVREYVWRLEQIVIDVISQYGIKGDRLEGATGVWIDVNGKSPRKICAIGVKCSRHITMHGLALNVNTDLSFFNYINPCGFIDKGVTSIKNECGKEIDIEQVYSLVAERFEYHFNSNYNK